jgi:hypothetical protein
MCHRCRQILKLRRTREQLAASTPPHRQRSDGALGYVDRRGQIIDSPHADFSDDRRGRSLYALPPSAYPRRFLIVIVADLPKVADLAGGPAFG